MQTSTNHQICLNQEYKIVDDINLVNSDLHKPF